MRAVWKREMQGYFYTPLGFVYLLVFILTATLVFFAGNLYPRSSDLAGYYAMLSYLWMLLTPLLAMRLIAGERRQMTDQLLMTAPSRIWVWVTAKFLSAATVLFIAASLTMIHVAIVAVWGRVYFGEFLTVMLGFLLQGLTFTALGFFVASLCRSPTTAFMLSLGVNLLMWLADLLADVVKVQALRTLLSRISLYDRFRPFLLGQLSFANILFFLTFSALCVVLSVRFVEARRWSERA